MVSDNNRESCNRQHGFQRVLISKIMKSDWEQMKTKYFDKQYAINKIFFPSSKDFMALVAPI